MKRSTKIGESEGIAVITVAIATKIYLSLPMALAHFGGSAAWMISFFSGLLTIIFMWLISKLLTRFPDKTFPEIAEECAGTYLGIIASLTILICWIIVTASPLRSFSEMTIIAALPETPISIIVLIFIISTGYVVFMGIQAISRASYLSLPYLIGAIVIIVVLTFSQWDMDWVFPIFGRGLDQVFIYGLLRTSDYLEVSFLYMFPLLFYSKQVKTIGLKGISLAMAVFLIVIIPYIISTPAASIEEPYLPMYTMARSVYLGLFLQRIEAIFVLFWVVSGCLWMALGIYGSCQLLADILRLSDHRPLILPVLLIIFSVAFIPGNLPDTVIIEHLYLRNYGFIPFFGIPIGLLCLAVIRGKGAKGKNEQRLKK